MSDQVRGVRRVRRVREVRWVRQGVARESFVVAACFLRGLPLFFRGSPRTPLRVLGIITLDTLHRLHHSHPLPRKKIRDLALVLDFLGCANAAWDHKELSTAEYHSLRRALDKVGLSSRVEEYLNRLRELESRRPLTGGDVRRFHEVRTYREAVARLALAIAVAIVLDEDNLEDGVRATECDGTVNTLFRILMQCQIIDDVMDYKEDLSAGLPSFLTASRSLPQAIELTADAARSYAASGGRVASDCAFPLRVALPVFGAVAQIVIRVAHPGAVITASPSRLSN